MSRKEKVYCGECKYYVSAAVLGFVSRQCHHPYNVEDSWFKKDGSFLYSPEERNRNNDCVLFGLKEKQEAVKKSWWSKLEGYFKYELG